MTRPDEFDLIARFFAPVAARSPAALGLREGTIVTRDEEEILVRENESIYLPLGCAHRLATPGKLPLNLIEVQSGPYLQEDDIVRIDDDFARLADRV